MRDEQEIRSQRACSQEGQEIRRFLLFSKNPPDLLTLL
jgi:hypothetical protein